jgi:saccharopine dehydrogenase-like NADP-dependent oxidoreductase
MKRAIVLGAGMVGKTIAEDLTGDFRVTVADIRQDALDRVRGGHKLRADLANPDEVKRVVEGHDIVIGALSSNLGLGTLEAVVEAGKSCCDISFMEEDPRSLSALARERGATVIVDAGVSPGLSNVFAGWAAARMSPCERISILVGGVPEIRRWPFEYKAPYAPTDVFEIYTRPARIVRDGKETVLPALSETELVDIEGVGTLEAFNTDGLRSLIDTLAVPHMVEKTLRYPGHAELMRVFRESGFFGTDPITVEGVMVEPLAVTRALLMPKWKLDDGEREITVLRLEAEGVEDGERVRHRWLLVDRFDEKSQTTSMARSTGYPAAIMAKMIADGQFERPGVHPPEILGQVPGLVEALVTALHTRGVRFERRRDTLNEKAPS